MATITYGSGNIAIPEGRQHAATVRKPWYTRLFDRFVEGQMRKAERDLARYRHLLPQDFERAAWKVTTRNEDQLPFVR